jgi:predicted transcriptional regulator
VEEPIKDMAGQPITKKTDIWEPITKAETERRPTTPAKERPQEVIITACRQSGLDGFEIVQVLADWYGWQRVTITPAPGIVEHTVTNSWSQSRKENENTSSHSHHNG